MTPVYRHLGIFSDIVDEASRQQAIFPIAQPGSATQQKVKEILGWCAHPETPLDVVVKHPWEKNGLYGEEVSWSVGYGPRTQAWFFKPSNAKQPLPGVLALHDHGGFKYYGKEKIAEGTTTSELFLEKYRQAYYGGRTWVNSLAMEGFAVLVHDAFLWGSRKFPIEIMKETLQIDHAPEEYLARDWEEKQIPQEVSEYNYLAGLHEHVVSKYCNLLGTGIPGVVSHEDRIALNYLRSRTDVQSKNIACMGLSGGGNRAGMLRATGEGLKAAVIVGLMSTYEGLLDQHIDHTWMLYPFGWSRYGDWPDLVACQAPAPLLVQFNLQDELFTEKGMRDAHARLQAHYRSTGHQDAYTGEFYPGPHKFDLKMQGAAFNWLKRY